MTPADTTVLLIDAQAYFVDRMHGDAEPVLARLERLLRLGLPVIATFETRKGRLPPRLEKALPLDAQRFEKDAFDCTKDAAIRDAVGTGTVVVGGSETDVCVLLSVLSLLEAGCTVHLLEDCVFSSEVDTRPALRRMYAAGAVPTTFKSFFYELTQNLDESERYPPPESLPPRGK